MFEMSFGELTLVAIVVVVVFSGRSLEPLSEIVRQARARRPIRSVWRISDWALLAPAILLASFALAVLTVRFLRGPS